MYYVPASTGLNRKLVA